MSVMCSIRENVNVMSTAFYNAALAGFIDIQEKT